ncbi:uncharacterized protein BJ171DRAFT_472551 [Polychytrium aggregatum]|uniref:uncharacterized protein n=1 Tax=Polychytrium aggregatum TaxID=110093 RepID=UPI0022FDC13B|nr:uncharacterized protein BJ171DRAFT_472551 [Polychytrium aggregatum]KAI9207714.1 hypothetical protein BJ171DRAFT_472551 [Polychytrium aggregatum]
MFRKIVAISILVQIDAVTYGSRPAPSPSRRPAVGQPIFAGAASDIGAIRQNQSTSEVLWAIGFQSPDESTHTTQSRTNLGYNRILSSSLDNTHLASSVSATPVCLLICEMCSNDWADERSRPDRRAAAAAPSLDRRPPQPLLGRVQMASEPGSQQRPDRRPTAPTSADRMVSLSFLAPLAAEVCPDLMARAIHASLRLVPSRLSASPSTPTALGIDIGGVRAGGHQQSIAIAVQSILLHVHICYRSTAPVLRHYSSGSAHETLVAAEPDPSLESSIDFVLRESAGLTFAEIADNPLIQAQIETIVDRVDIALSRCPESLDRVYLRLPEVLLCSKQAHRDTICRLADERTGRGKPVDAKHFAVWISKCGASDPTEAEAVFQRALASDVLSSQAGVSVVLALMSNYRHNGRPRRLIRCFRNMLKNGLAPTALGIHFVIEVYLAMSKSSERAVQFFTEMVEIQALSGELDPPMRLPGYESFGFLPNTTTFNLLLAGSAKDGAVDSSVRLYNTMLATGVKPTLQTFSHLFDAFAASLDVRGAKHVLDRLVYMGYSPDRAIYAKLIQLHVKRREMALALDACSVMEEQGLGLDVGIFGLLIDGYGVVGDLQNAERCFSRLLELDIQPTPEVVHALIRARAASGKMDSALALFDEYFGDKSDWTPGIEVYTTMIEGFCNKGLLEDADNWWDRMRESGIVPSLESYTALIRGYVVLGARDEAIRWIRTLRDSGITPDVAAYNTIIAAYIQTKDFAQANQWIQLLLETPTLKPQVSTFETILETHIATSNYVSAIMLYDLMKMLGVQPSERIYRLLIHDSAESISSLPSRRRFQATSDARDSVRDYQFDVNRAWTLRPRHSVLTQSLFNEGLIFTKVKLAYRDYRASLAKHAIPQISPILIYQGMMKHLASTQRFEYEGTGIVLDMIEDGICPDQFTIAQYCGSLVQASGWLHAFQHADSLLLTINRRLSESLATPCAASPTEWFSSWNSPSYVDRIRIDECLLSCLLAHYGSCHFGPSGTAVEGSTSVFRDEGPPSTSDNASAAETSLELLQHQYDIEQATRYFFRDRATQRWHFDDEVFASPENLSEFWSSILRLHSPQLMPGPTRVRSADHPHLTFESATTSVNQPNASLPGAGHVYRATSHAAASSKEFIEALALLSSRAGDRPDLPLRASCLQLSDTVAHFLVFLHGMLRLCRLHGYQELHWKIIGDLDAMGYEVNEIELDKYIQSICSGAKSASG